MHRTLAFSPEPFGEVGESLPLRRVHVNVFPMTDVLIIHDVIVNSLGPCKNQHRPSQCSIKEQAQNKQINQIYKSNHQWLTKTSSEQL